MERRCNRLSVMTTSSTSRRRSRTSLRLLARAVSLSASGDGRRIREAAGVGLTPLAASIGASIATLSRWERGLSRPNGPTAVRWVQALDDLRSFINGGVA